MRSSRAQGKILLARPGRSVARYEGAEVAKEVEVAEEEAEEEEEEEEKDQWERIKSFV